MEQKDDKTITIVYPDGKTASKIVDLIARKRPIGWGRRSYSTYYKECYGIWMKEILDDMMARRVSKFFPYKNFPSTTRTSLYTRINMSKRYVMEELDPEGIYRKFDSTLRVDKTNPEGIALRFIVDTDIAAKAEDLVATKDKPKWLARLDTWLESDEQEPFVQENLMLSGEEIENLKNELDGLEGIQSSISVRAVRVIKI